MGYAAHILSLFVFSTMSGMVEFTPRGGNNMDCGQGRKRFYEKKNVGGRVKKHFNEVFQTCNIIKGFLEEYYQLWTVGKGGNVSMKRKMWADV